MRALLDVNVLIALLDADHVHHGRARHWLLANARAGWASCPITQNGCIRIMSQPAYPSPAPTSAVIGRLAAATATAHHEFWPDDVSLLDPAVVDPARALRPREITDLYLLALAVSRGGRFVTFDGAIGLAAVTGATPAQLVVL